MEWGEFDAVRDCLVYLSIDTHRFTKVFTTVDNTMPDRVNVGERGDLIDARCRRHDPAEYVVNRGSMIPQGLGVFVSGMADRFQGDQGLAPDPFDDPAGKAPIGVTCDEIQIGFDDLELDG